MSPQEMADRLESCKAELVQKREELKSNLNWGSTCMVRASEESSFRDAAGYWMPQAQAALTYANRVHAQIKVLEAKVELYRQLGAGE